MPSSWRCSVSLIDGTAGVAVVQQLAGLDGTALAAAVPQRDRHTGWFRRRRTEARCIPPRRMRVNLPPFRLPTSRDMTYERSLAPESRELLATVMRIVAGVYW
jgi:hypothetical protein